MIGVGAYSRCWERFENEKDGKGNEMRRNEMGWDECMIWDSMTVP